MMKAVLFDLDGTLLDRDQSVHRFIVSQYDRFSNYLDHIPVDTYLTRFVELDCRGYTGKDMVYSKLVKEFNIPGCNWESLYDDYFTNFHVHCVPFPNLIRMLENLKRNSLILGVITNGYHDFQLKNIKALEIKHYFDVILVSETEGIKKPNPEIFKRAIDQLGVSTEESIFVGDHPENDIAAAKSAGMTAIWKKDEGWSMDETKADFIIDDLLELCSIYEEMDAK
ncbi:L-2-haloalkanoic acid dehalogenase [Bacillus sp. V33-4]|nr:HAD family hydrolase [Bacillus sp. V33-4]PLR83361.1 L-2-haloalkanoic acid dehalogenase [Bacillus sp. V33-4]